ncbi:MAG: ABC transporter substrate-binding protein [Candidatus Moranbacteria bacterium]|nr:ABC transporter substrate-binding protein [Candidatus Moranbacteria bacterium]
MLNLKEKVLFYALFLILIGSAISWGSIYYYSKTEAIAAYGGEYIEGIVGQPMHINPVISASNDTDDDLAQMIFSSLFKYDDQGKLSNDLIDSYEASDDKTQYIIRLKKGVFWHDGQPLTASDILFTINLISDPAYKSPLRSNWQGIETDILDDYSLEFKIKTPYVGFLNNLTFGVLPKHIWESVGPDKFSLTDLNLEPIGSGPYKYGSFQKDSNGNILSYRLVANPNYFAGKPYISKITFDFYPDDESVIAAYNTKEIMGINNTSPKKLSEIKLQQSTAIHKFNIPRYFAVFFNQSKSVPVATDEVREALAYATDRQEIINAVLDGNGNPVYSPILPGMIGYDENMDKRNFDLDKANQLLDSNDWQRGEDGIRAKNDVRLEINLITTDWPELSQTAEILKSQWGKIGIMVNINNLSVSDIQQNYIRPREYDALLFGQVLGADPDPYSFWHSSQKRDPGLNLSLFGDSETDKLIEDGRIEFDTTKRTSLYADFQKKLNAEIPAIFLYSPDYVYPVNKKVQGIDVTNLILPSERFANIDKWYIATKRIWK